MNRVNYLRSAEERLGLNRSIALSLLGAAPFGLLFALWQVRKILREP